jgi:hypothetical protein
MKSAVVFGVMGTGLLLLILSGVWNSLFPGTSSWTAEKSKRLSDIRNQLHNLAFSVNEPAGRVSMHSGPERGMAKQEYDELKKESDALRAEFQSAHDRPKTTAKILKWTGISLVGVGIVGWYAVKNMES